MRALPLADRVLFAVKSQRPEARTLARLFDQDIQVIYRVLRGLEDRGLVIRHEAGRTAATFHLAPDAVVEYRPGRLVVEIDGVDPRTGEPVSVETATAPVGANDGRCEALTTKGSRCRKSAVLAGFCHFHAPS